MRLAFAAVMCILLLAPIHPDASAQTKKQAQPDTTSTETLFNPPRVITPDDTASVEAASSTEAVDIVPGTIKLKPSVDTGVHEKGTPGSDKRAGRLAGCAGCGSSRRGRFGGGGGFVPGYVFANLEEINPKIKAMGIPELSDNILMVGGKGYARIGHLVIGGGGYGGTTESTGIPDGCARYAELELAYGGIILGMSLTDSRYEATAGMLLGGGAIAVERRRNSRDPIGWDGAWDIFYSDDPDTVITDDLNVSSILRADFIALEPFIEIKYWVLSFIAVDLSVSYLRAKIDRGEWTVDSVKIPDSPETNIGGPSVKLGIHFGV
jgi:hypothetical protein